MMVEKHAAKFQASLEVCPAVAYKGQMPYESATTEEFDEWLDLQEHDVREAITTRIVRAESGLFGDIKSVGEKVTEMRLHIGPGYRVYFTIQGRVLIILLCGGEKKSQKRDLKRAQKMVADL